MLGIKIGKVQQVEEGGAHTSITQLLAKLLAMLLELAVFALRIGCGAALADLEGHVAVAGWGWRGHSFVLDHVHIATGEDTLEVSPLVTSTPP